MSTPHHKRLEELAVECARLGTPWNYSHQMLVFQVTAELREARKQIDQFWDERQTDLFDGMEEADDASE